MTDFDRHFYLYAKLWYKRTNIIDDMKVIMSKRSGVDTQFIRITDIIYVLTRLVQTTPNFKRENFLEEFATEILPSEQWKHGGPHWNDSLVSQRDIIENIVRKCLSILSNQSVKDIPFELGLPDSEILPVRTIDEPLEVVCEKV